MMRGNLFLSHLLHSPLNAHPVLFAALPAIGSLLLVACGDRNGKSADPPTDANGQSLFFGVTGMVRN